MKGSGQWLVAGQWSGQRKGHGPSRSLIRLCFGYVYEIRWPASSIIRKRNLLNPMQFSLLLARCVVGEIFDLISTTGAVAKFVLIPLLPLPFVSSPIML